MGYSAVVVDDIGQDRHDLLMHTHVGNGIDEAQGAAEDDEDADCRHDDEFTAQAFDHIHGLDLRRRFFQSQDIVLPSFADDFDIGLDGFEFFP